MRSAPRGASLRAEPPGSRGFALIDQRIRPSMNFQTMTIVANQATARKPMTCWFSPQAVTLVPMLLRALQSSRPLQKSASLNMDPSHGSTYGARRAPRWVSIPLDPQYSVSGGSSAPPQMQLVRLDL